MDADDVKYAALRIGDVTIITIRRDPKKRPAMKPAEVRAEEVRMRGKRLAGEEIGGMSLSLSFLTLGASGPVECDDRHISSGFGFFSIVEFAGADA